MENKVPALQKGDLIYITAPAKAIEQECVESAVRFFEKNEFRVLVAEHCLGNHHYFSGTDDERRADFQRGLDDPEIKAIICARGGYGSIRILDGLQWASMLRDPKFIVGFSDVTVFHQRMQGFELESIHGTMPLNFEDNSDESLETLLLALQKKNYEITSPFTKFNRQGEANGRLVGGNLSILYSLLGTDEQIDYSDTILFIEDLAEQLYHLDRMMFAFAKAGIFEKIAGLVVGGMSDMKDTAVPFGKTYQDIILEQFCFRKIPIAFDFPAGHVKDNRALVLGKAIRLHVGEEGAQMNFDFLGDK